MGGNVTDVFTDQPADQAAFICFIRQGTNRTDHKRMMRYNQLNAETNCFIDNLLREIKSKKDTVYFLRRGPHQQAGIVEISLCFKGSCPIYQIINILYRHDDLPFPILSS